MNGTYVVQWYMTKCQLVLVKLGIYSTITEQTRESKVPASTTADGPKNAGLGDPLLVNGESAAPGAWGAAFGLAPGWMGTPCELFEFGVAIPGPVAIGAPTGWTGPADIADDTVAEGAPATGA